MIAKIILIVTILSFLGIVYLVTKGWIDGRKMTSKEMLDDLEWKIDYSILNGRSKKCLLVIIEKYRKRAEIDKTRLRILNIKFEQRFINVKESD